MSYITNSSAPRNKNNLNSLTTNSTGTDPAGWRRWWAIEAERIGTDWPSVLRFHLNIVDSLRSSS
jgi:hypothetical protein